MSLLNPCHGEKRSAKPTFSLSQMSRVQTRLKTLPWLEKVGCFKGRTFAEGSDADAGFRKFQVVSEGIKHVKHLKLFLTMNHTNCEFYGFSLGFFLKHLLVGTGFQPAVVCDHNP